MGGLNHPRQAAERPTSTQRLAEAMDLGLGLRFVNWQVRLALFSNPNVPGYIIRRLSDDIEPHIRAASIKRMEEDLKKGIR